MFKRAARCEILFELSSARLGLTLDRPPAERRQPATREYGTYPTHVKNGGESGKIWAPNKETYLVNLHHKNNKLEALNGL